MHVNKERRRKVMEVLGIDIGGSAVKGAIVQANSGKLLTDRIRVETKAKVKPKKMGKIIKDIADQFGWNGIIGIGFPGIVKNGVAQSAANINKEWVGIDINLLVGESTGLRVYTINDADAAGLAEMALGSGKKHRDDIVVMLTLGTGIGSAVFLKGNLLPNTEFGHIELRGKDAEKRASAEVKTKKKLGWQEWSSILQEYLNALELLINPDVFIIGGGISKDHEKFFPLLHTKAKIIPAHFFNQAGIIGAALYAQEQNENYSPQ